MDGVERADVRSDIDLIAAGSRQPIVTQTGFIGDGPKTRVYLEAWEQGHFGSIVPSENPINAQEWNWDILPRRR